MDNIFVAYRNNPSVELRNEIVEKYLYMVDILIRKYLGKGVEYDDLYQIGALALVNAVERFDPERGFEFSSFATPTILGEIKKYFRDKQWSLKVPRRMKEIAAIVQKAKEQLTTATEQSPSVEQLAIETGFSQEDIIEAMESSKAYGTYSLDKTFDDMGDDGDGSILEQYIGFNEMGYEKVEVKEIVDKVTSELSDTYRLIFKERFFNNRTQSEIAQLLGVSQMTVSRVEKNIKEKLKTEFSK